MCAENDHDYVYTGVRFKDDPFNRPGGSAHDRYYAHVFHCRKCLDVKSEQIGRDGTNYDGIKYDATPAAGDEVQAPKGRY